MKIITFTILFFACYQAGQNDLKNPQNDQKVVEQWKLKADTSDLSEENQEIHRRRPKLKPNGSLKFNKLYQLKKLQTLDLKRQQQNQGIFVSKKQQIPAIQRAESLKLDDPTKLTQIFANKEEFFKEMDRKKMESKKKGLKNHREEFANYPTILLQPETSLKIDVIKQPVLILLPVGGSNSYQHFGIDKVEDVLQKQEFKTQNQILPESNIYFIQNSDTQKNPLLENEERKIYNVDDFEYKFEEPSKKQNQPELIKQGEAKINKEIDNNLRPILRKKIFQIDNPEKKTFEKGLNGLLSTQVSKKGPSFSNFLKIQPNFKKSIFFDTFPKKNIDNKNSNVHKIFNFGRIPKRYPSVEHFEQEDLKNEQLKEVENEILYNKKSFDKLIKPIEHKEVEDFENNESNVKLNPLNIGRFEDFDDSSRDIDPRLNQLIDENTRDIDFLAENKDSSVKSKKYLNPLKIFNSKYQTISPISKKENEKTQKPAENFDISFENFDPKVMNEKNGSIDFLADNKKVSIPKNSFLLEKSEINSKLKELIKEKDTSIDFFADNSEKTIPQNSFRSGKSEINSLLNKHINEKDSSIDFLADNYDKSISKSSKTIEKSEIDPKFNNLIEEFNFEDIDFLAENKINSKSKETFRSSSKNKDIPRSQSLGGTKSNEKLKKIDDSFESQLDDDLSFEPNTKIKVPVFQQNKNLFKSAQNPSIEISDSSKSHFEQPAFESNSNVIQNNIRDSYKNSFDSNNNRPASFNFLPKDISDSHFFDFSNQDLNQSQSKSDKKLPIIQHSKLGSERLSNNDETVAKKGLRNSFSISNDIDNGILFTPEKSQSLSSSSVDNKEEKYDIENDSFLKSSDFKMDLSENDISINKMNNDDFIHLLNNFDHTRSENELKYSKNDNNHIQNFDENVQEKSSKKDNFHDITFSDKMLFPLDSDLKHDVTFGDNGREGMFLSKVSEKKQVNSIKNKSNDNNSYILTSELKQKNWNNLSDLIEEFEEGNNENNGHGKIENKLIFGHKKVIRAKNNDVSTLSFQNEDDEYEELDFSTEDIIPQVQKQIKRVFVFEVIGCRKCNIQKMFLLNTSNSQL